MALRVGWPAAVRPWLDVGLMKCDGTDVGGLGGVSGGRRIATRHCVSFPHGPKCCVCNCRSRRRRHGVVRAWQYTKQAFISTAVCLFARSSHEAAYRMFGAWVSQFTSKWVEAGRYSTMFPSLEAHHVVLKGWRCYSIVTSQPGSVCFVMCYVFCRPCVCH